MLRRSVLGRTVACAKAQRPGRGAHTGKPEVLRQYGEMRLERRADLRGHTKVCEFYPAGNGKPKNNLTQKSARLESGVTILVF